MIEKIVDNKKNTSGRHWYAVSGLPLVRVRWYGYEADDETEEPTRQLQLGKILSYCRNKHLPITENIDQADDG